MHNKPGWWALIGLALSPLSLYAGAYYYEVRPQSGYTPPTWTPKIFASYRDERPGHDRLDRFFWPMHQLDRRIRPSLWTAPPERTPVPADARTLFLNASGPHDGGGSAAE